MKNIFKVSTIVGVVVFFVPAYSMEEHLDTLGTNATEHYLISLKYDLNLFSEIASLDIRGWDDSHAQYSLLRKDNPLFTDKDLSLPLSVIQAIQSDAEKSSTILENIGDAVCQGVSLASRYSLMQKKALSLNQNSILIKVNSSGDNYISIFSVIEDWIKQEHSDFTASITRLQNIIDNLLSHSQSYEEFFSVGDEEEYLEIKSLEKKKKALDDLRSSILKTIFAAGIKRKNDINYVFKKDTYDRLKIDTPQDIIDLIFSYLHGKESVNRLKQTEQNNLEKNKKTEYPVSLYVEKSSQIWDAKFGETDNVLCDSETF